ncbi:MAG TPA: PA14 domain-containing protein, partial [Methanocella sp.]|nr:PA14 domain-containing protein [Methanocella sp.]
MGMLIAIFITVLIAGAAIFYILSFHVPDRPSMAAYSAVAENSSTLRITSIAGNSIPQGSISLLLDNTRISSLMLQDSNTNSRWDPGEVLYSYGLNLTEAHRLTISSNANVIFETTVQYHGPAGNTTDGPMYASGVIATYYSDEGWTAPAAARISRSIQYADDSSMATYPSSESHWPTAELGKAQYFSVDFSGLLKIDAEADYTFYLTSDDGSYLTVDGAQVIDNGGLHSPLMRQATKHLTPGYHDIDVKMYQHAGQAVARLEYSSPSISRQFITQLYHVPADRPIASFTGTPRGAPVPLQVQFADNSLDALTWHWDFGDGSTSTDPNPLHVYTVAGTYNVSLAVTNGKGSDIKLIQGYIHAGGGAPGFVATYYSDEAWNNVTGSETISEIRLADVSGINAGYPSDRASWPVYMVGRDEQFSVICEGSLLVSTEADYTFYLTSDDGSYLTVDGAQVIDNGGLHSPAEKQGTVHLTPGYHDIETKMYEHTG